MAPLQEEEKSSYIEQQPPFGSDEKYKESNTGLVTMYYIPSTTHGEG